MTTLKLPALDKAAPIVETAFGRITPYFQRFWQNVTTELARAVAAVEVDIPNELALKAPLDSPALTGTPTAPTAASGTDTTQIATTAFAQAAVAGLKTALVDGAPAEMDTFAEVAANLATKAPLESPVLTGAPSAPTAPPGTDSTQLATTAFAQAAITALRAALVDGAPADSDTFAEVAAILAGKAPLASPALTGAPTAPTAAPGEDSTRIATTAYADQAAETAAADKADAAEVAAAIADLETGKADKAAFAGLGAPTGSASGAAYDVATVTLPQLAAYVAAMRQAAAG